ncbi:MAG: hypothetical protein R2843_00025, partial [Thermomicrobiales bacterium]
IIDVEAGRVLNREVFISRNFVEYTWNVEEIEVEDRTRITMEATFETNVPAPVVVVESDIDLEALDQIGDQQIFEIRYTNHGLIQAEDIELLIGEHPFYTFEPLVDFIPVLPAKAVVVIPVKVTRVNAYAARSVPGPGDPIDPYDLVGPGDPAGTVPRDQNVPCSVSIVTRYEYDCGPHTNFKWVQIPVAGVDGNCGGGGFAGGSGPGGGSFVSSGVGSFAPPSVTFGGGGGTSTPKDRIGPDSGGGDDGPPPLADEHCGEELDGIADDTNGLGHLFGPAIDLIETFLPSWYDCGKGIGSAIGNAAAGGGLPSANDAIGTALACASAIGGLHPALNLLTKGIGIANRGIALGNLIAAAVGGPASAREDDVVLAAAMRTAGLMPEGEQSDPRIRLAEAGQELIDHANRLNAVIDQMTYVYGSREFVSNSTGSGLQNWLALVDSVSRTGDGDMRLITGAELASLHASADRPEALTDSQLDA